MSAVPFAAAAGGDARHHLLRSVVLELVPMSSLDGQLGFLPPASRVSVTCSPVKGIDATLELAAALVDAGHHVVPHLAARMVLDRDHTARVARWLRDHAVTDAFVIAGDAPSPHGPYDGATAFLRDLLAADPGLERVGVAAYPDGHVAIEAPVVHDALHAKQAVILEAGVAGYVATQMCFDAARIVEWLEAERVAGFDLPVQLGVPGPVDRAKLLSMGARLGVGASLRYLRKNRSSLTRMLSFSGYDPSDLIDPIAAHADRLGIVGLHVFTFNNLGDTVAWRARSLGQLG